MQTAAARSALAVIAVIAAAAALAGCTGDAVSSGVPRGASQCHTPAAAQQVDSALPRDLDLDSFGTVTEVVRDGGFVNATAVADGSLAGLQRRFARTLRDSGYAIVGSENEVVEADVFFARGQDTTGGAKFIQTGCAGQVRIQLFIGESASASG
ncbi:MAG: hypothetical protein ACRD0P_37120 [Stackebrandtia sp.]